VPSISRTENRLSPLVESSLAEAYGWHQAHPAGSDGLRCALGSQFCFISVEVKLPQLREPEDIYPVGDFVHADSDVHHDGWFAEADLFHAR